jgi:hypothetical protein
MARMIKQIRITQLLILFGILDLIIFIRWTVFIDPMFMVNKILVYTFLVSAILLILKNIWGIVLYYAQFLIRIGVMILSIGFIIEINSFFKSQLLYNSLVLIALIFEILRLITSIIIHKNLSNKSKSLAI